MIGTTSRPVQPFNAFRREQNTRVGTGAGDGVMIRFVSGKFLGDLAWKRDWASCCVL